MRQITPFLLGVAFSAVSFGSVAAPPENFDLNAITKSIYKKHQTTPYQLAATENNPHPVFRGYPSQFDSQLGTSTFLWVKTPVNTNKSLQKLSAEQLARQVIQQQALLGVSKESAAQARLVELHDTGKGPLIARFQQQYNGLDVYGRSLNVLMDRQLNTSAISGYFAKAPAQQAKASSSFALSATEAVAKAFADMTGQKLNQKLKQQSTTGQIQRFQTSGQQQGWALVGEPSAKPLYYSLNDGQNSLIAAYYVEVLAANDAEQRGFGYVIDASTGRVLVRKNQISDLEATYRVWADSTGTKAPYDSPLGNELLPSTARDPSQAPARTPADTQLVTLKHGPISTQDPWLAEGATETVGNNVDAYLDLAGIDGYDPVLGDKRAPMTAAGVFDHHIVADGNPTTESARLGAVVNLFYINNWMHDDWYDNGFNEASRNAQRNNYGRGGLANDPIFAEGQDGGGRNNANMYTPSDGTRPRMQMYLWDGPVQGELKVITPAELGPYAFGTAVYGPETFAVEGDLIAVDDGTDNGLDGCEVPFANAADVAGKLVLIQRGNCNFVTKTANAQSAGAIGVVIANNVAGERPLSLAGADDSIEIGTLSITKEAGDELESALTQGQVRLSLKRDASTDYDGTVDIGIVAHEFFHYVSNRLIHNSQGLVNLQGAAMGEGWSDVAALLMAVRPEDKQVAGNDKYQGPYGIGQYVSHNTYFGIRRAPYSTDFSVYPMTFKHMGNGESLPETAPLAFGQDGANNAEVHATGEIWANILWEFYASLLNDPRYSFAQARERMQDYLVASLKMTPDAPTYLEARDAILAVTAATDEKDWQLAANAFAKRGMGVGAKGPDRWTETNADIVESYIAQAAGFDVVAVSTDYNYDNGTEGYCSKDGVLDEGESVRLSFTIQTYGTDNLTQPLKAQLSSDADISFANAGKLEIPTQLGPKQQRTVSTSFRLNKASTGQPVTINLSFADPTDANHTVIPAAAIKLDSYVNFDLAADRTSDDLETPAASLNDWQRVLNPQIPDWQVQNPDGSNHYWHGPDLPYGAKVSLTTPELQLVPGEELVLSFDHWFSFEYAGQEDGLEYGYDGGILQVSLDGGSFNDVTLLGGGFTEGGYNGFMLDVFGANPAFVGKTNEEGQMQKTVLSMGSGVTATTARFRFLSVSDGVVGDIGWMVDNITISGISNQPFSKVVSNAAGCDARPTYVNAGADFSAKERAQVKLNAQILDRDGTDQLQKQWIQTAGPLVTLSSTSSLTPEFTAPSVDHSTVLQFKLQASDGVLTVDDSVQVSIEPVAETPPAPPPTADVKKSSGSGSPFSLAAALVLLALRRSRIVLASLLKTPKGVK